jgi:DNA repair exonuclease SbcCD ATPase subunit
MPEAVQIEQALAETHAEHERCATMLAPLESRLAEWRAFDIAYNDYEQQRQQCAQLQSSIDTRWRNMADTERPAQAKEKLGTIIDMQGTFNTAIRQLNSVLQDRERALANLQGQHAALDRQIKEAAADGTPRVATDEEELAGIKRRSEDAQQQLAVLSNARAAIQSLVVKRSAKQQLLDDAQAVNTRAGKVKAAITHLENVRRIFHHNEAPRMVNYTYMEHMLEKVNETLRLFETPFAVELDDDVCFVANFADGRRQLDKHLSVGERIVLSLAFRIVMNATFAGQLGMLVLDEPTAGLDEHNMGCLPLALDRLRELSSRSGLQVIFVTHEPRISHLFDHVVELGCQT